MNKFTKFLIYLPQTLVFNFYYFPVKQAFKIPVVFLSRPKFKQFKGKVKIECQNINFGMIKLGGEYIGVYSTNGSRFIWENRGLCCFKGTCVIGHNSAICTGKNGYIEFGNNFGAGTTLRIVSYKSIVFGENFRVGWEVIIMDTDFHETINIEANCRSIATKEIIFGKNNWIGIRTLVLKGTITPVFCIVGANSLLNKKYEIPNYSLIAGNPARLCKTGIYRDLNSFVD